MGKFESYPSINSLSDDDITLYNHDTVTHKINFARLAQLIKTKVSETIPIQGSNNLVTSGGIYNAIKASADSKADKATTLEGYGITNAYNMVESDIRFIPKYSINSSGWDNTPTENSTNPVISGGVYTSVSNVQSQLQTTETTPTEFYFDYQGGKYGWNSSSARGADTFHPFKQPATQTKVITAKTTTDLGEDNEYRYIDTTGVVNTNSGTYKPTTRNISIDMGASNSYRYVNTSEVPNANSGTYTASSRGASLDMGATNSYRYVNTNGVPNSNSGTYTFPSGDTGGTKDMGASNSYRYVNATNVYNQGKYTLIASTGVWVTCKEGGIVNFSWYYTTREKFKYLDISCSNDQGIPLNSGDTIALWIGSSGDEYWGSVYSQGSITSGQYIGGKYRFMVPDGITIIQLFNTNAVPRDYIIRMLN